MLEQPSGPPQKQSAKLERKTGVFTGKVVLVDGAYRLSLLNDPDTLLRLTRARRETEFEKQQINLRKYYQKTISVNGTLQDEWIFGVIASIAQKGRLDEVEREVAFWQQLVFLA
jgi:hypothetical protein